MNVVRMGRKWLAAVLVAVMMLSMVSVALMEESSEGALTLNAPADAAHEGSGDGGVNVEGEIELVEDIADGLELELGTEMDLSLDLSDDGMAALEQTEGEELLAPDRGEMVSNAAGVPAITYQAHVQQKGWLGKVSGGATAGTTGNGLRLEALKIMLTSDSTSMVKYRAHVSGTGWMDWVNSGKTAGTTGKGRAIEAVQIKLTGAYGKQYDIYYRAYLAQRGWLGWAKNGEMAGSTGMALQMEAIQIRLVKKGGQFQTGGSASLSRPKLTYAAHCQSEGWQSKREDGGTAGNVGKSRRLEALKINLKDFDGGNGISYRAFVNDRWQDWTTSGNVAGSTGEYRAIEAVEIRLSDSLEPYFDLYYRMHVAYMGWLGWARNGEPAGTTGGWIQAEAIEISLVNKGAAFDRGGYAWHDAARTEEIRLQHHMTGSLRQQERGPCCAYAYAIGLSVLFKESFDPMAFYGPGGCHYDMGHVGEYIPFDAFTVYAALKEGRPTMMRYRFGNDGQHWVLIIGVRAGANMRAFTFDDFIVIDPQYGDERNLTDAACFSSSYGYGMKVFY